MYIMWNLRNVPCSDTYRMRMIDQLGSSQRWPTFTKAASDTLTTPPLSLFLTIYYMPDH